MIAAQAAFRCILACSCLSSALLSISCIQPKNYHQNKSTILYQFPNNDYFKGGQAYEAFIEFDERGRGFSNGINQVEETLKLIDNLKKGNHDKVIVIVFVHGWKNNASEDSGNMWGFRRVLDEVASQQVEPRPPVIGVYLGWPGASANVGKFFTFWSRHRVAEAVAKGDITGVLEKILIHTKGPDFDGPSYAVLVGHSFGGLIMEQAAINILTDFLDKVNLPEKGGERLPPADLMVVLNEAGAADQARPFLVRLLKEKIEFTKDGEPHPLLLSLTSAGDLATKLAFPGGQFVSTEKPSKWTIYNNPPDPFGLASSRPYYYLTAANTVALQSHEITNTPSNEAIVNIPAVDGRDYFVVRKGGATNTTPYWIIQIPQVFIPDHGSVFRPEVIALLRAFLVRNGVMAPLPKERALLENLRVPSPTRPKLRKKPE